MLELTGEIANAATAQLNKQLDALERTKAAKIRMGFQHWMELAAAHAVNQTIL